MSVLIKGMQIPENCTKCGLMCALRHFNILNNNRPSNCPLIELPEHHGRLIDADVVTNKYGKWYTEEGPEEGFIGTIKDIINLVPTVIKAE